MNMYPALRSQMGTWVYYVVKMRASELSANVRYASEVHDDHTLDRAIQRRLDESRVKNDIVEYLRRNENRFFSAIVVAALEGNPQFIPIEIPDTRECAVLRNDARFNSAFGALHFDGNQRYYALDGQHRLSAIKTLLKETDDENGRGRPENFEEDEVSVIVVVPSADDSDESFMQKYRRLFSNLNRYAKPMDNATNIIMDEDDTFAILTRRLMTDHTFFHSDVRRQMESEKIKTEKGENLRTGDSYFTSIETLYKLNMSLLTSEKRRHAGWKTGYGESVELKTFQRFRPSEAVIDLL